VKTFAGLTVCFFFMTLGSGCAIPPDGGQPPAGVVEASGSTATAETRVFQFGEVTAHLAERRVEVDVEFCLKKGILEFFAVAEGGKAYESVLVILCEPSDLHLALLAAGFEPGDVPEEARGDYVGESSSNGEENPESRLDLFLEWTEDDETVRVRAEKLMFSIADKGPAGETHWVFTGSYFVADRDGRQCYAADAYRSVIAVWYDPSAVINLPVATGNPYRSDAGFAVVGDMQPSNGKAKLIILPHRNRTGALWRHKPSTP